MADNKIDFTSGTSNFRITYVTFNGSHSMQTAAYGEAVNLSVKVKNISGRTIEKVCVWGRVLMPSDGYISSWNNTNYTTVTGDIFYFSGTDYSNVNKFKTVSWKDGEERTFSGTIFISRADPSLSAHVNLSNYSWGAIDGAYGIRFCVYSRDDNGSRRNSECNNLNRQGLDDERLHILSQRDNPYLGLSADRYQDGYQNDEGQQLYVAYSMASWTGVDVTASHGYSASLTYSSPQSSGAIAYPDIHSLFNGLSSTNALGIEKGLDYTITLSVSNGYESAVLSAYVPKSFANVHLSGASTGGVRFGGFCTSTEGNPKFECDYPAYFSRGIVNETGRYHSGESFTITDEFFFGYVTGGKEHINIKIPLYKSLELISSGVVDVLVANIANSGGYALTEGSITAGTNYVLSSITRTVSIHKETNSISINLVKSGTFPNITNNDCINVRIKTLSVTLY